MWKIDNQGKRLLVCKSFTLTRMNQLIHFKDFSKSLIISVMNVLFIQTKCVTSPIYWFFYIKLVFSTLVQKDQSAFLMGHWGLSFPPNCFNLSQTHSWALEEDVQGHIVHARTSVWMTGMYQTYIIPVSTPTKVTGHGNAFDIVWSN